MGTPTTGDCVTRHRGARRESLCDQLSGAMTSVPMWWNWGSALETDAGPRDPREPRGVAGLSRVVRRVPVTALDRVCTPPPKGRPCESLALWSML